MLKLLRKKGVTKKILWVILVLIILSFGLFGTAYLITNKKPVDYAGTIFGKKISAEEFSKAYQAVYVQALIRFGDKFSGISRFLNLEAETWDRLILLREAAKRKIKASDEEVVHAIEQYAFFQRDGHFDPLLYNDILRYAFRVSARDFEEGIRDNLKFITLFQQITSPVAVTGKEVLESFRRENEKIQASYILVTPEQFEKDVSFNDEEAQNYYAQNKNEFIVPPTMSVEYIGLDFPPPPEGHRSPLGESLTAQPEPKKEETAPEAAKPATAVDQAPTVTEEMKKPAREKATAIFQDLLVNPDMQAAGEKHNVEVKSSGFFSMEQPDLALGWSYELLIKLFQMDKNAVNDPFETPQGMLIVKIKEKKDAYIPEQKDIAGKVAGALRKNKAKTVAREKAEKYLKLVQDAFAMTELKDFAQTVKGLGLEVHQTPVFGRGEYLPLVGISKEFQDAAFALTEQNNLSGVIATETGYSVVHLDSRVPADEKQFEEKKQSLSEKLLNERRTQTFNDFLSDLRLQAKVTSNLPQKKQ
ncbi:MAG: peptidylprolyl isomerase [Candidatus Omnitrophica bacterium]|nr:peptidylprolyl isomerase [Candidatus Omnitrophota bacterium]